MVQTKAVGENYLVEFGWVLENMIHLSLCVATRVQPRGAVIPSAELGLLLHADCWFAVYHRTRCFCVGRWCLRYFVLTESVCVFTLVVQRTGQFDDLVIGEGLTAEGLKDTLEGRKIVELRRRGKQMWFVLDR